MRYVLAVILLVIIAIIFLLVSKMTVQVSYREDGWRIQVRLLFLRYTLDSDKMSKKKRKEKELKNIERVQDSSSDTNLQKKEETKEAKEPEKQQENEKKSIEYWLNRLREYYDLFCDVTTTAAKVLRALRYKIQVRELVLACTYGTGDAAKTGMAYGGAWAAVSQLYMLFQQYFVIDYPRLELTPVFDRKCFSLAAEGIICFRPVHIIKAAIVGFAAYYKRRLKK